MNKDKKIFYLDLGDFLIGKDKREWKVKIENRKRVTEDGEEQEKGYLLK